jgi:DNA-binding IclR family transcriptional regulator
MSAAPLRTPVAGRAARTRVAGKAQASSGASPAADADATAVGTLRRSASLLRALETVPWGMSLSQLAEATALPRSTVHRLLVSMQAEQLVAPASEAGGYRLGPAFVRVAASVNRWIVAWMRPELVRLSAALGETVDLAFLVGRQMIFTDQVVVAHRLQAVSAVGSDLPLHCTASGKALLHALPDEEVLRLVDRPLQRYTPNTLVDDAALLAHLAEGRRTRVALDREEHHLGVCGAAIAFPGPFGGLAAVGTPVPTSRFVGREAELTRALLQSHGRLTQLISRHG